MPTDIAGASGADGDRDSPPDGGDARGDHGDRKHDETAPDPLASRESPRLLARQSRVPRTAARRPCQVSWLPDPDREHANRSLDVLDLLLTDVDERHGELTPCTCSRTDPDTQMPPALPAPPAATQPSRHRRRCRCPPPSRRRD